MQKQENTVLLGWEKLAYIRVYIIEKMPFNFGEKQSRQTLLRFLT